MSLLLVQPISGPVAASNSFTLTATARVNGGGSVSSFNSELFFHNSASLKLFGKLSATSRITVLQSGAVKASTAISATNLFRLSATATGIPFAKRSGNSSIVFSATGNIVAKASTAGQSRIVFNSPATLSKIASIFGNSVVTISGHSALKGFGLVSGTSAFIFNSAAPIKAKADLSGIVSIAITTIGAMRATGNQTATNRLTLIPVAGMRASALIAGSDTATFTTTAATNRGFGVASKSLIQFEPHGGLIAVGHPVAVSAFQTPESSLATASGKVSGVGTLTLTANVKPKGIAKASAVDSAAFETAGACIGMGEVSGAAELQTGGLGTLEIIAYITGHSVLQITAFADADGLVGLGPRMSAKNPRYKCVMKLSHRMRESGPVK